MPKACQQSSYLPDDAHVRRDGLHSALGDKLAGIKKQIIDAWNHEQFLKVHRLIAQYGETTTEEDDEIEMLKTRLATVWWVRRVDKAIRESLRCQNEDNYEEGLKCLQAVPTAPQEGVHDDDRHAVTKAGTRLTVQRQAIVDAWLRYLKDELKKAVRTSSYDASRVAEILKVVKVLPIPAAQRKMLSDELKKTSAEGLDRYLDCLRRRAVHAGLTENVELLATTIATYARFADKLPEDLATLKKRLPVLRGLRAVKVTGDRLAACMQRREWQEALAVLEKMPTRVVASEPQDRAGLEEAFKRVAALQADMLQKWLADLDERIMTLCAAGQIDEASTLLTEIDKIPFAEESQRQFQRRELEWKVLVARLHELAGRLAACMQRREWQEALAVLEKMPARVVASEPQDRAGLEEAFKRVAALQADMPQKWLADLDERIMTLCAAGQIDEASTLLTEIDKIPFTEESQRQFQRRELEWKVLVARLHELAGRLAACMQARKWSKAVAVLREVPASVDVSGPVDHGTLDAALERIAAMRHDLPAMWFAELADRIDRLCSSDRVQEAADLLSEVEVIPFAEERDRLSHRQLLQKKIQATRIRLFRARMTSAREAHRWAEMLTIARQWREFVPADQEAVACEVEARAIIRAAACFKEGVVALRRGLFSACLRACNEIKRSSYPTQKFQWESFNGTCDDLREAALRRQKAFKDLLANITTAIAQRRWQHAVQQIPIAEGLGPGSRLLQRLKHQADVERRKARIRTSLVIVAAAVITLLLGAGATLLHMQSEIRVFQQKGDWAHAAKLSGRIAWASPSARGYVTAYMAMQAAARLSNEAATVVAATAQPMWTRGVEMAANGHAALTAGEWNKAATAFTEAQTHMRFLLDSAGKVTVERSPDVARFPLMLEWKNTEGKVQAYKVACDIRDLAVFPGTYTFRIDDKCVQPWFAEVHVVAGWQRVVVDAQLKPGGILILSTVRSAIREANQAFKGVTGEPVGGIHPGVYSVWVEHEGYRSQITTITVYPDAVTTQTVMLAEARGTLLLHIIPPGNWSGPYIAPTDALVTVGSVVTERVGSFPCTLSSIPTGIYDVAVNATGYEACVQPAVEIHDADTNRLFLPVPAHFKIRFNSVNGEPLKVAQDGKELGTSGSVIFLNPFTNTMLCVGAEGCRTKRYTIRPFPSRDIFDETVGLEPLNGSVRLSFALPQGRERPKQWPDGIEVEMAGSRWSGIHWGDTLITNVTPGAHSISVRAPGYSMLTNTVVTVIDNQTATVCVTLMPANAVVTFVSPIKGMTAVIWSNGKFLGFSGEPIELPSLVSPCLSFSVRQKKLFGKEEVCFGMLELEPFQPGENRGLIKIGL